MADIFTRLHDQTLLLQFSSSVSETNAAALFVNAVEILIEAERATDVRSILLLGSQGLLPRLHEGMACEQELHDLLETLETGSLPVLAVLDGAVSRIGLSLALACDGIVGSRALRLQEQAMSVSAGSSWQLGQRLPRALASQLMLAPHTVQATQLHAAGIFNALVDDADEAFHTALRLAAAFSAAEPAVVQAGKELLRQAGQRSLHAQLEAERQQSWMLRQRKA